MRCWSKLIRACSFRSVNDQREPSGECGEHKRNELRRSGSSSLSRWICDRGEPNTGPQLRFGLRVGLCRMEKGGAEWIRPLVCIRGSRGDKLAHRRRHWRRFRRRKSAGQGACRHDGQLLRAARGMHGCGDRHRRRRSVFLRRSPCSKWSRPPSSSSFAANCFAIRMRFIASSRSAWRSHLSSSRS